MTRLFALTLAVAALGGCAMPYTMPALGTTLAPAPVVAPVPAAPIPAATSVVPVVTPSPVVGVAGLQSREPDACHAATYRSSIGQPGSVIPSLGVTRDYRIVEYRGIEPQEYDALRIVFRLDASGNIQAVDCG